MKSQAAHFDLGAIAAALEAGDAAAALEAALAAWRQTRATALADLIDVISSKIVDEPIETDATWSAVARERDPAELGRLLAAIPTLAASFLPAAGQAFAAYDEDPRLAMAIATWALDPMTTSSQHYPFWTKSLDAMTRAADVRALPLLKERLTKPPGRSTFWPKFYKALEKAIAKIAATPRTAVDEKAIDELVTAANALEAAGPARVEKPPAPKPDGPPLARAVEHLEAGRVQAAIDAMLDAWRVLGRVPAIADAIDRATRLLPTWDRALCATDRAADAAWTAAFDDDPQATMPQLLDYLRTGGPQVAERHLLQLAALPEDPRIAYRVAELAARPDISPERTLYWKATFDLLARIRDPRVAPTLCTVFRNFEGGYHRDRQAHRTIGDWAMNPPTPPQLGAQERADLDTLDQTIAKLAVKRTSTEHALLAAVVDAWDDVGPRHVYADWLSEHGHPRGELVVLACKPDPSAAETKRLRVLLRKTSNLFGVLENFALMHSDDRNLALVRGLPTKLDHVWWTSSLSWPRLAGDPLLATIETIMFGEQRKLPASSDVARVLLDPTARRLSRVKSMPQDFWNRVKPLVDGKWKHHGIDLVRA